MKMHHRDEKDEATTCDAVVIGEEAGDKVEDSTHPQKWRSNVTIFSCVCGLLSTSRWLPFY